MVFNLICPSCGTEVKPEGDFHAGSSVKCGGCKMPLIVGYYEVPDEDGNMEGIYCLMTA